MRAHIAQLEQRKAKIQAYEVQVNAALPVDTNRVTSDDHRRLREIASSLERVQNQIDQYTAKLVLFTPKDDTA